ncbi:hypothetical protein, partial [Salmonella enterica]|uniref:hypothetical protein n=1 Tax=Salmonella enterica TaxID=28901 RepID=UPI001C4CEE2F
KLLKFLSIFSVGDLPQAARTDTVWRSDLEEKKTEKFLRSRNRRRVRCSAVFVCERFILSACGVVSVT